MVASDGNASGPSPFNIPHTEPATAAKDVEPEPAGPAEERPTRRARRLAWPWVLAVLVVPPVVYWAITQA